MAVPGKERAYAKNAWIILFVVGVSLVLLGLTDLLFSSLGYVSFSVVDSNPSLAGFASSLYSPINLAIRTFGYYYLPFGILVSAVSLKSYRRGEKWAWYVFLLILALWVCAFLLQVSHGLPTEGISIDLVYLILWILGLLLPFGKFFPKKQVAIGS